MSSPATAGKYVPVHRRSPSTGTAHPAVPVYTPAALLALAKSPLAKTAAAEQRPALRAAVPELVLSSKRRRANEWHAHHPAEHTGDASAADIIQSQAHGAPVEVLAPLTVSRTRVNGDREPNTVADPEKKVQDTPAVARTPTLPSAFGPRTVRTAPNSKRRAPHMTPERRWARAGAERESWRGTPVVLTHAF